MSVCKPGFLGGNNWSLKCTWGKAMEVFDSSSLFRKFVCSLYYTGFCSSGMCKLESLWFKVVIAEGTAEFTQVTESCNRRTTSLYVKSCSLFSQCHCSRKVSVQTLEIYQQHLKPLQHYQPTHKANGLKDERPCFDHNIQVTGCLLDFLHWRF